MSNSQPLTDPVAVNRDPVNQIGNNGQDMRWAMGALSSPSTGNTFGHRSGVFPGGTGGPGYSNDLQVFPTSGMSLTVNGGHYAVDRNPYGLYIGAATGSVTLPLAVSSPSLPRIDYVVIRVRDPGLDTGVTETAKIIVLQGSPGSVPVEPSAQMTSGDLLLASVRVRANTSSVLTSDITDRRQWISARGGITPRRLGDLAAGSYEGEYADDVMSNMLMRWSGTSWEPVASPAVWTQWTPQLYCTGQTYTLNLGTGAQYVGRFQLIGKRLDFNFFWKWGTRPYNGGTGDIYSRLPTHPVTGAQLYGAPYDQWVQAHLWVNDAYTGDFAGQALIWANNNTIRPHFFVNAGSNSNIRPYKIANTLGVTNGASSVPNIFNPNGFPEGGNLALTGSCEVSF